MKIVNNAIKMEESRIGIQFDDFESPVFIDKQGIVDFEIATENRSIKKIIYKLETILYKGSHNETLPLVIDNVKQGRKLNVFIHSIKSNDPYSQTHLSNEHIYHLYLPELILDKTINDLKNSSNE